MNKSKKVVAALLALLVLLLGLPAVQAATEKADLQIEFKPTEDQSGNVVLEIDANLKNGELGQSIDTLEFRYENTLIASVDSLSAQSSTFVRSNPLGLSLTAMTSDLEIEVTYVDFDGTPASKTLFAQYQAAEPKLTFTRTASQTASATGEKIRLTYRVKNEGSILLTDLVVYDDMEGVGQIGTVDTLYPGDMKEFTYDVRMTKDVKSQPRVSYKAVNSLNGMVMQLEALDLIIYNPKLNVTLKSDVSTVQAGDAVTLVCNVVNEGNVAFTNVSITDLTLGSIIDSAKIDVGKAYSWNKLIKPVASQNYMYTVKAVDANGKVYTATSNIVALEVSSTSQEINASALDVTVTPNTTSLSQPGEVNFNVLLRNNGADTISNVTISDASGNVLERINSLVPGDKIFPIAVNVTQTGDYYFVVSGTAPTGEAIERISTPVTITVGMVQKGDDLAIATDEMLASPTPGALTISNNSVGGISPWLLMLLIFIGLLIIACVAVLVWLQVRANQRKTNDDAEDYEAPVRPRVEQPAQRAADLRDPYDFREEISRVATEYSKPVQQPRRPSAPSKPVLPPEEDDEQQTVYKARVPREPKTKRND